MTSKITEINTLIVGKELFVQGRGKLLIEFINRLDVIKKSYNKNKLDFCIMNDLNQLYTEVCEELNNYITDTLFDINFICSIPQNPNNGGNLPSEGDYNGGVNNINLSDIQTLYRCYYSNGTVKGFLDDMGDLFNNIINMDTLQNIISQFDKKKANIEKKFLNCKLIDLPVIDLILLYKEASRHIKKLEGLNVDELKIPGEKCDILYDLPVINPLQSSSNDTCGMDEFEISECEGFTVDSNFYLFDYLTQPFFNGEDGGSNINGCMLQIILTKHYHEFISNIVCPIIKCFKKINDKIIFEKNKLIPFEVGDILDIDTENCSCSIINCDDTSVPEMDLSDCNGVCDNCRNTKFYRIKKLFGTKKNIQYLLDVICIKIKEIENFYKQTFVLTEPNTDINYINEEYGNPELLSLPIQNGLEKTIILYIKDKNNDYNITEKMVCDFYDMLNKCKLYLNCFLNNMDLVKDRSIDTREIKDDKTLDVKECLQDILDRFIDSTSRDITLNLKSEQIDINLSVNYQRYLQCITLLRCKMVDALTCLNNLLDQIDDEQGGFNDVYLCSEYYKFLTSSRWFISDNNKDKKPSIWLLKD